LEFVQRIAVVECEGGRYQWLISARQLEHVVFGEYMVYKVIVQNKDSLNAVDFS
jgi:hypothetical protein